MTALYLQMFGALALVIGAIVALGAVAKKRQSTPGAMKVLAYQSLGQKKGIAAVQAGAEVLLLAVTATDLKLLKTADEAFARELIEKDRTTATTDTLTVLRALKERLYAAK